MVCNLIWRKLFLYLKYPSVRFSGMELVYIEIHPQTCVYLYIQIYRDIQTHTYKGIYQEIIKGGLIESKVDPVRNC